LSSSGVMPRVYVCSFSGAVLYGLTGRYEFLKTPLASGPPAQRDPAVVFTVSDMLSTIEKGGMDAVAPYAATLDDPTGGVVELSRATIDGAGDRLPPTLREALDVGAARTRRFAQDTRSHLVDFETELAPGLVAGQRYVPVQRVGAYLPAGRFPLLASAFMTVNVAKMAGVDSVLACRRHW